MDGDAGKFGSSFEDMIANKLLVILLHGGEKRSCIRRSRSAVNLWWMGVDDEVYARCRYFD